MTDLGYKMPKHVVYTSIVNAVKSGRLEEPFTIDTFKKACPGFAEGTYKVFLKKHRVFPPQRRLGADYPSGYAWVFLIRHAWVSLKGGDRAQDQYTKQPWNFPHPSLLSRCLHSKQQFRLCMPIDYYLEGMLFQYLPEACAF